MKEKIKPRVTILVANYNSLKFRDLLDEFFESVLNLNYPKDRYEVIVVDNGSRDGSLKYIRENYPRVRVIELDKNYGFAKANNIGASLSTGEFLALMNNDTVLDRNWLIEMVKYAVEEPNAIYCSKTLRYDKRDTIVFNGGKLLKWGWTNPLQCYQKDNENENAPILSFYADGCGTLISKETFSELGGFDEDYVSYCEDYSLSWKALLHGYKIYCIPTSKFYHKISETFGLRRPLVIYLFWRNSLRNIIKYPELSTLLAILPLYIFYSLFAYIVYYSFQEKNFLTIFPMIKAHFHVLRELPKLLKERKKIQAERKISDKELSNMGLILSFNESIKESLIFLKCKRKFWEGMEDKRWY